MKLDNKNRKYKQKEIIVNNFWCFLNIFDPAQSRQNHWDMTINVILKKEKEIRGNQIYPFLNMIP